MAEMCCQERDARHCMRMRPGLHETSPEQPPDIIVPHYEDSCNCFSCRWVRETKYSFKLSRLEDPSYPVVNPTHARVAHGERQRLMTPVARKKFQIMYIYAMELRDKTWGWVVVLPRPLQPFLLTDDKYCQVSRFCRHPERGWFGLRDDGHPVSIEQEIVPPLYNPLYEYLGYEPNCSPYRVYRPPAGDSTFGEPPTSPPPPPPPPESQAGSPPCRHQLLASPACSPHEPPSPPQPPPSEGQAIISSAEIDARLGTPDQIDPDAKGRGTPPLRALDSTSPPATAVASPPGTPAEWPAMENDEWTVVDPRCANPPAAAGPCNQTCGCPGHNGRYFGQRRGNRHTDWKNTTVFVGGLDGKMAGAELHGLFEGFGELLHVRKKGGQTCGFVQYARRTEAEMAMSQMQGFPVAGGARLRLSWGEPARHMDQRYRAYYTDSAWRASNGYVDFRARMRRGEERRDDDPDFWTR